MIDPIKQAISVASSNVNSLADTVKEPVELEAVDQVKKKLPTTKNKNLEKAKLKAKAQKKLAKEKEKALKAKSDATKNAKNTAKSTAKNAANRVVNMVVSKKPTKSKKIQDSIALANKAKKLQEERQATALANTVKNIKMFSFPMKPSISLGIGTSILANLKQKSVSNVISQALSGGNLSPLEEASSVPYCGLLTNTTAKGLCVAAYNSGITDKVELAQFLAQSAIETSNFTRLEENLLYTTVGRVLEVFPSIITTAEDARSILNDVVKAGNRLYRNRLGNTLPNDGYTYRGRGFLQITGKENYNKFQQFSGNPVVDNPSYLSTVEGATESALWFWKSKVGPRAEGSYLLQNESKFYNTDLITRAIKGSTSEVNRRNDQFLEILRLFNTQDEDGLDFYYH